MIEKIKNKKNLAYLITFFLFLLFNCGILLLAINTKYSYFEINKKSILLILCSTLLPIVLLLLLNNRFKKLEKKYLFLIITLGLLFMVSLPINAIPDEGAHTYRAYEVSEGHLVSVIYDNEFIGRKLPKSLNETLTIEKYSDIDDVLKATTNSKRRKIQFNTSALYSFICYLPQSLGIAFARLFTKRLLIQLYFGRLFNFALFVLLMYFSIKIIPIGKNIVFLIGLLPITIQEAISLSPDALTIAASIFLISYILYLREDKKKLLTRKQYIILLLLCIIISQCKIVYLPLIFILFLLPDKKFKTKKHKYICLLSIVVLVIALNIAWLNTASSFLEFSSRGKSSKQLTFIMHNPFKYMLICINTFNDQFTILLYQLFGKHLGWNNISIPDIYIFINIIFFILLSMSMSDTESKKVNIDKKEKFIIISVFTIIIALIFTSLYIQWNPYKNNIIEGIQGRYLLPIILLVPLSVLSKTVKRNNLLDYKYIDLFLILQNISAISLIIIHHF